MTQKLSDNLGGEQPPMAPKHMAHYQNEQRAIIRQTCIKAAAHIVSGTFGAVVQPHPTDSESTIVDDCTNAVISMAEKFEVWVLRASE